MPLQCQMTLNVKTCSAGQSPPPQATLTVYNPNASSVAVTGIALQYYDAQGAALRLPVGASMPAMGPGQTVVVPTLSSITFGPFPIAIGLGANGSNFLAGPAGSATSPSGPPWPRQLGMPTSMQVFVGAIVYGSDGSINDAGRDGLVVSWAVRSPSGTGGGTASFADLDNSAVIAAIL